jgi:outer membrane protein OmpA-like peptidoglycan-associated protein
VLALLAGCGHRDPIDTPLNWWHQLEGGAIAQQRPPPPGVDDPYPRIGTTPAAAPKVASVELRHSVTEHLVEQRNLSARLNAHDPLPPPVMPGPNTTSLAAPARPNPAQSSATLDAAEAPPPARTHDAASAVAPGLAPGAAPTTAPGARTASAGAPDTAELAMPEVVSAGGQPTGEIPAIPVAPPAPPGLPGIAMPPPPAYVPPARPDYVLAQGPGDTLQFAAGSDVLGPGQSGTLHALAMHRGATGSVYVHGYGEAASDAPQDQAQALTLAALRARSVADALEKEGVPASAIRIRADAFGRGARAGLVD